MLALVLAAALAQADAGTAAPGPVVDNLNGVPSPAPAAAPLIVLPPHVGPHSCGVLEKDLDSPGCAFRVAAGALSPFSGVLLDGQEDVHRTRRETRSATKVRNYETGNFIMPVAAYLGITGGAVAVALAVLSAVLAATGHLK